MTGYKIEAVDAPDGKFFLWRPRSLPPLYDEQNNLVHGYHIDILNGECQCWVWCRTRKEFGIGECKHLLYTRKEVEKSLRMLGLWQSPRTLDDVCETYTNEKIYPTVES